ncbi:MAG: hypothetical protein ABJB32_01080 [Verrucomicrobiota bacterium]
MPDSRTALHDRKVVFVSGNESFTMRDLIDWASFRGELEPIWKDLLRLVACENKAAELDLELDDSAIDAAAEGFRYERDLITAEETEHWLEERGLTLSDFSDYFVRHHWGNVVEDDIEPAQVDYLSAPDDLRELLTVELILSGELDQIAIRLSWRVAGSRAVGSDGPDLQSIAAGKTRFFKRIGIDESELHDWLGRLGRDPEWFSNALSMEAIHRGEREALLTKQARQHEVAALRLPLTRFELETVELDSYDAAREALLCVRDDEMSMAEVAAEGRYRYRCAEILLEDLPEDLQQKFLSVSAGDILEPIPRGDGFHLCRVIEKMEPNVDDLAVKDRAEKRILERHFAELTAKYIQWRTVSTSTQ